MLKTENRIEVIGTVSNYKIMKNDKTGKKRAFITIKDSKANNFTSVTLYDRESLKYGDQEVTLSALKNIFLDANDKSKNVLVHAVGSCSESYDDKKGKLYENNNIFFINPCDDEEKQKSVFAIKGFVETVNKYKELDKDGEEKECLRVRVGSYTYKSGTDQNEVTGTNHKTLIVRDDAAEKLGDVETGSYVEVGGRIFNQFPERDEFGLQSGSGKKEYSIVVVKKVIDNDDIDEKEVKLFTKARKLKTGESMTLVVKDETSDVDEEAFD